MLRETPLESLCRPLESKFVAQLRQELLFSRFNLIDKREQFDMKEKVLR